MRSRHLNFALAIVASAAAHVLLWPAAERIVVPMMVSVAPTNSTGEVTLLLNDDPPPPAASEKKPEPPKVPKPAVESPDDMGEANAHGTGAQAAKGKDLLRAPEADQDQAFLSRDPVGMGRVGDPPVFFTGPRGEDGSGGQVGGAQAAINPAHAPSPDERKPADDPSKQTKTSDNPQHDRPPRESAVHLPEPEVPTVTPPKDVAPPPSKTASVGSAVADVNQPPVDEVKAHGPLAQLATTSDGALQLSPEEGPTTQPVKAS
ncbi:MAG TPA: hypothetical protein VLL04_06245, partial [Rhizomicrobium sp.]|nr:hypothetical protein [Rhizomicrobium sp.]